MKKRWSRLMFLSLCIFFVIPFYVFANPQLRDIQIDQELSEAECARHALGWSDVCDVGNYHSRSAAVSDALSRAEASYYKKPSEVSEPVVEMPQESVVIDAPVQPPQIPPEPEAPVTTVEPDRMAVVDEALNSYVEFHKRKNSFETSAEIFNYTYDEEGLMNEKGTMYGMAADYRYRFKENQPISSPVDLFESQSGINVLMFDARFNMMFNGQYTSDGSGEMTGTDYYGFETRLMGGYEIPIEERRLTLMPYAGFGWRYLLDDSGGRQTTTGYWSYDRESRYFYLPIGIEARKFYNRGWSVRFTAEYDWFINGRQKSHLECVSGYYETLTNDQNKGHGLRASLKLAKEIEAMEFFVEPFIRHWRIGNSGYACTTDVCGYEPTNTTGEYGARFGVRF